MKETMIFVEKDYLENINCIKIKKKNKEVCGYVY